MIDVTYPDKQDISERRVSIQNKHHKCNITHTPRDNLLPGVTNNEKIIAALFLNIVYSKKKQQLLLQQIKEHSIRVHHAPAAVLWVWSLCMGCESSFRPQGRR